MPEIVVAQDEWSPKPGVAQDRFYCIHEIWFMNFGSWIFQEYYRKPAYSWIFHQLFMNNSWTLVHEPKWLPFMNSSWIFMNCSWIFIKSWISFRRGGGLGISVLLLLAAPTWLWGRCGRHNSLPASSAMDFIFCCFPDGSRVSVDTEFQRYRSLIIIQIMEGMAVL